MYVYIYIYIYIYVDVCVYNICIYIYIYIHTYIQINVEWWKTPGSRLGGPRFAESQSEDRPRSSALWAVEHPVSITRFPLRRFSQGAGLLRYVLFIGSGKDFPGAGSEKTGIFSRRPGVHLARGQSQSLPTLDLLRRFAHPRPKKTPAPCRTGGPTI